MRTYCRCRHARDGAPSLIGPWPCSHWPLVVTGRGATRIPGTRCAQRAQRPAESPTAIRKIGDSDARGEGETLQYEGGGPARTHWPQALLGRDRSRLHMNHLSCWPLAMHATGPAHATEPSPLSLAPLARSRPHMKIAQTARTGCPAQSGNNSTPGPALSHWPLAMHETGPRISGASSLLYDGVALLREVGSVDSLGHEQDALVCGEDALLCGVGETRDDGDVISRALRPYSESLYGKRHSGSPARSGRARPPQDLSAVL